MIPKRLSREIIYESDWVSLYADKVEYPNGYILDRHHLVHFDYKSVAVVVKNEKDEVLLIKSNRYVTQSEEWEIPAGRVDNDEPSIKAATREVLEETGYTITDPQLIYKYNPSNGISDQVVAVYKANALKKEGQFDTLEVMDIKWVSKETVTKMITQNEIRCGLSLTGLMLVLFCGL
ncbi:MAG: NUDIX hydrolase [Defluviitaleaceae bacterium]|nr:NUDIX hydrolase [Defluviitaleaceae bacterium]